MGIFDYFKKKTPAQMRVEEATKMRKEAINKRVREEFEKTYEKEFKKQALVKAREKAKAKVQQRLAPKKPFLSKLGDTLKASDKFFANKPAQAHNKATGKAVMKTKQSSKTVADLLKEMPK